MFSEPQLSVLMAMIFVVLAGTLVIISMATGLRPRTPRQRTIVWGVLVYFAWVLLGFGWLRSV